MSKFKVGDRIVYTSRETRRGVVVETRYSEFSQVQWSDYITYNVPYVNGSGDCHTIRNSELELEILYDSPLYKALT